MKYQEALKIIDDKEKLKPKGFMVHFERREGGILHADYFPDTQAGEDPIESVEKAWELAERFAKATDSDVYVNIYVIHRDHCPVYNYENKTINRYPQRH